MTVSSAAVTGGFADPVFQSQSVFRAVMDAMARPGTIHRPALELNAPAPLGAMAAAVALTLVDADTPLWLGTKLRGDETVRAWISFHTGAPIVSAPDQAAFAIASDPASFPILSGFGLGTQEYPDRSTTIILQVGTLDAGDQITLAGPGIETTATIAPGPLPPHFAMQWTENRAHFPRGVDLILTTADAVACLPRTVRIVEKED